MDIDITDVYLRIKNPKSNLTDAGFAHFEVRTKSNHDYSEVNFDDLILKEMKGSRILEWKYTFRDAANSEKDIFDDSMNPIISRLSNLNKRSAMSEDSHELVHFIRANSARYDEVDLWCLAKHELHEIIGFRMEQSSFGF